MVGAPASQALQKDQAPYQSPLVLVIFDAPVSESWQRRFTDDCKNLGCRPRFHALAQLLTPDICSGVDIIVFAALDAAFDWARADMCCDDAPFAVSPFRLAAAAQVADAGLSRVDDTLLGTPGQAIFRKQVGLWLRIVAERHRRYASERLASVAPVPPTGACTAHRCLGAGYESGFRLAADELPTPVFLADLTHACKFVNATWYRFTGMTPAQSLGRGWLDAVHPDDRAGLARQLPEGCWPKRAMEIEYRLRRRDGAYRWYLVSALRLPDDSFFGAEIAWVGVLIDIHDRKAQGLHTERLLRRNHAAGMRARLAWIAERNKVDHLQQAQEAREVFVAALSHDLRTPLTAARLGVERLAARLAHDPSGRRIGERVEKSITRMDTMIGNFLDVTRASAGRTLNIVRVPSCLLDVVKMALEELMPLHAGRCVLGATEPVYGLWDPDSIRRVIDNLLSNALKYGDRAKPISVSIERRGRVASLHVHNAGEAIPAAERATLFDRFTRLASAKAHGERGWGMGLALVSGLAKAHGGRVEVVSEVGQGTTFSVILPIVPVETAQLQCTGRGVWRQAPSLNAKSP